MANTIVSAFGTTNTIADIVSRFDFSKIDVRDKDNKNYLTTGIAPSFGKLNRESVKEMDDNLKVIIAGTTRLIAKLPSEKRTWENLLSLMMENPLIEPMDAGIHRADKLIKQGVKYFKFDGSPDSSIVREVHTWFTNLINDPDVLHSTQINIDVLGGIVAQTGATIVSVESFVAKNEYYEKTVVDIGVLRYPDIDQPYFKVYRIKLDALFVQDDKNGIAGEFTVRQFKPCESAIAGLREDVLDKAREEADSIFGLREAVLDNAREEANSIFGLREDVLDKAREKANSIFELGEDVLDKAREEANSVFGLVDKTREIADGILGLRKDVLDKVREEANSILELRENVLDKAREEANSVFGLVDKTREIADSIFGLREDVLDKVREEANSICELGEDVLDKARAEANSVFGLVDKTREVADGIFGLREKARQMADCIFD